MGEPLGTCQKVQTGVGFGSHHVRCQFRHRTGLWVDAAAVSRAVREASAREADESQSVTIQSIMGQWHAKGTRDSGQKSSHPDSKGH